MNPAAAAEPVRGALADAAARNLAATGERVRLSPLGWLVLAEALALLSTVFWQSRPLGVALGAGLVLTLILARLRAGHALGRVAGRWQLPPPPHAGDEATLGAVLSAPGGAPPLRIEAWQPMTRRAEVIARLPGLDSLPCRSAWIARFPRRGFIRLPPLVARCDQPFGLFAASRALGDGADLLVLPSVGRVRREMRNRLNQWLEAQAATPDPGDDEIARLRDYRPGDHPHRVHWKASARHLQLLVAERHAPGCRRVALVVDTAAEGRQLERMICIAATLLDHLLAIGWTVSVHGAFAPGGVEGGRQRGMEALAIAGGGGGDPLTWLPPGRTAILLTLAPVVVEGLRPQPLVLTLAECEQLMWLPRRVR